MSEKVGPPIGRDESIDSYEGHEDIVVWRTAMIGATILCFFVYFVSFCFAWTQKDTEEFYKGWSALGTFIGGVLGPVVAYAAFYWLTESVRVQKKELAETRNELAKAAEAQNQLVSNGRDAVKLAAVTALMNVANTRLDRLNHALILNDEQIAEERKLYKERALANLKLTNIPATPYEDVHTQLKDRKAELTKLATGLEAQVEELKQEMEAVLKTGKI